VALLSSAFEPDDVLRLLELAERQAEELRALREEAERRTELLRRSSSNSRALSARSTPSGALCGRDHSLEVGAHQKTPVAT
jgi:hypothetical protein